MTRPAAGGGRWVTVPPERLPRWLDGFVARHGALVGEEVGETSVRRTAQDGAVCEVEVPFPPLRGDLVEHAGERRRVGVLLVRLGGYAAGVFDGPDLVDSKVGSRQVHGRSAAGGWSQQRFARRREGQASAALSAAADTAVRILAPAVASLDAVVVGGDRGCVDEVLADPRLAAVAALRTGRLLDVPDPRLDVLKTAPFRDIWIRVVDPA